MTPGRRTESVPGNTTLTAEEKEESEEFTKNILN